MIQDPSDETLLEAIRAGDSDSFGVLVGRWEQPLFRFAYRMVERRDDARDVCQETFLRVLSKSDKFRDGARFSTWMYQIALNLCRDHLRKKRRWGAVVVESDDARVSEAGDPSVESDPWTSVAREERCRALTEALDEIPAEQREVLVMKEYEGLKFREIAEILDCPESTVKSRMYYGLAGLKTALRRRGVEGI